MIVIQICADDGTPPSGTVQHGDRRDRFTGWLSLLEILSQLMGEPRADEPPAIPGSPDGPDGSAAS